MKYSKTDPRVSCPIVCGEYMRATGFFFRSNVGIYLVTVRHNVLPTEVTMTNPDQSTVHLYSTDHTFPKIDIYLRNGSAFDQYRVDIRDTSIRQTPDIDVIGVKVDFDVENHGYHVWTEDDLEEPGDSSEELSVIGFDRGSFPDSDLAYNAERYAKSISNPRHLRIENPIPNIDYSEIGLVTVGIDKEHEGRYDGLSGSPVLGNGLVGLHCSDTGLGGLSGDYGDIRRTTYVRSAVLPELLG